MLDFLAAIDSRGKPVADIEQGYISTTSCILANLALELGRTLEWDPHSGQVVGDKVANQVTIKTSLFLATVPTADQPERG